MPNTLPLKVFLCLALTGKPAARKFYCFGENRIMILYYAGIKDDGMRKSEWVFHA